MLLLHFPAWGCDYPDSRGAKTRAVRIMAASSLTDAFAEMKEKFQAKHPDLRVTIAAAGSQTLRLQIEQGARAEIFASANRAHMRALRHGKHVGRPRIFARNKLVIALPRENPGGIRNFRELAGAKRIVLAAARVPAGEYADRFIKNVDAILPGYRKRVLAAVVSRELNVRLVLTRVVMGEADAAVVYYSDTLRRPVKRLRIPDQLNVLANYYMAVPRSARGGDAGERWMRFVLSPAGQSILARHGFSSP